MIHYHGTPITPDRAAAEILMTRHGLVSFAYPGQIALVAEVCQSFVLDNGAFTTWKKGGTFKRLDFYRFVDGWRQHPGFDWALIPDVIDGTEKENDALIRDWPYSDTIGVPVWHTHESWTRLAQLIERFPRVAFGSSGEYTQVGTEKWWKRMADVMTVVCDGDGYPYTKLHGLRMLNPKVFSRLPLASADSSNIARNIGIDKHWTRGSYPPPTKAARGIVMAERIEHFNSAAQWVN